VVSYCTHAVLSGNAIDIINNSKLDSLVFTDTIPLSEAGRKCNKIRQLPLARFLGESIRRVSNEESVSAMFDEG
jgi:ribose-phosphate pyrophosphokinase